MLVHCPVFAGEYFDFSEAGESAATDHFEDAWGGVDAFAGQATVEEGVVEVRFELADVDGEKVAVLRAGSNFSLQVGFPLDMEGVDGDTDEGMVDALG